MILNHEEIVGNNYNKFTRYFENNEN